MKVQRFNISATSHSWLVLGDDFLPIKPIQEFIRYLNSLARSPETVRTYATHLKLYWQFLYYIKKDWNSLKLTDFAEFLNWLRNPSANIISLKTTESKRTESTIHSILACISSFYNFHQQIGNTEISLIQHSTSKYRHYKPLLHHISKNKPIRTSLIKLKVQKILPRILTVEQIKNSIDACLHLRDKFLLSLLYESGIRIGQALGLRHSDIKSWDNEIHIQPRIYNVNQSRSKSSLPNVIHVTAQLMDLYSRYLLEEFNEYETDYVFIQISKKHFPGKPLNYRAIRDLFERLSLKMKFKITPHMFRHTHATELLKSGWDSSYVQRRLGHSSVQTTINTYAHLSCNDLKKAFQNYQETRKNNEK